MARKRVLSLLSPISLCWGLALSAQTGPTLASATPPLYPLAAKAAGHEGQVQLEMVLDTAGNVRNPRVVSGPKEFREAALRAVLEWHYQPYTNAEGKVQAVQTHVTVNFNLGNRKQKAAAMAKAKAELASASALNLETQTPTPATPGPR